MKKLKILLVLVATVCMTGCVKMNATMTINKDKSMDYEIITAFDESLLGDSDNPGLSEEEIQNAKDNGFKIEEYAEDSMKGYKMTKHVDNIDSISTKDEITGSLDADGKDEYIFTIKKGFFKNTYKAKLTSSTTDKISDNMSTDTNSEDISSSLPAVTVTTNNDSTTSKSTVNDSTTSKTTVNDSTTSKSTVNDSTTSKSTVNDSKNSDSLYTTSDDTYDLTSDDSVTTDDETLTTGDDTDYSSLMSSMDLKFEVNLPYKAKSNNATNVENGGKKLVWNLASLANEQAIEFEFEIYNMTSIYIVGGTALLVVILLVVMIIDKQKHKGSKSKKNKKGEAQENTQQPVVEGVEQPVAETTPVQPEVQPVAETTPAQPEVQPVAEATPVQPEVQPVAEVAPVQPEVHPVAEVAPVQPEVQPVAEATPVQPEVQPVAEVAPMQPEVQPVDQNINNNQN